MEFCISPTEPKKLRNLPEAIVSSYCEEIGADIVHFTHRGVIPTQRKTVPDFVASISDGRLSKEFALMREASLFGILLIEGVFRYTQDDKLKTGRRVSHYTRQAIHKILWGIQFQEGITICYSRNINETIEIIYWLQEWMDKEEHDSLRIRAGYKGDWFVTSREERLIHWMQGLPGISIGLAKLLVKKYPSPISLLSATVEDIQSIPKFGKGRTERIIEFLQSNIQNSSQDS